MPIYEYICLQCKRRNSFFVRLSEVTEHRRCQYCSSEQLERIMSRFAAVKSEESRLESLADPSRWSGLDENDPASVAKFVRKLGSEMGEDISKEEIEQMAEEAAKESESGFDQENSPTSDNINADDI